MSEPADEKIQSQELAEWGLISEVEMIGQMWRPSFFRALGKMREDMVFSNVNVIDCSHRRVTIHLGFGSSEHVHRRRISGFNWGELEQGLYGTVHSLKLSNEPQLVEKAHRGIA